MTVPSEIVHCESLPIPVSFYPRRAEATSGCTERAARPSWFVLPDSQACFRRTMKQRYLISVATSSLALGFSGCTASDDARTSDEPVAATQQAVTAIGDALPGTDPVEF